MFLFGDIVVVDEMRTGVIVKSWAASNRREAHYDVYVRMDDEIREYNESDIHRYGVRHKYLNEEELEYQNL